MTSPECRLLFVGAVEEGRRCLDALMEAGERFVGIVTLNETLAASTSGAVSFEDAASALKAPLLKVGDLNAAANVERVRDLRPDLILVIGWTRLLGPRVLALPRLGCVGFHASLLPRYRGRAPVNWAIINGETETGNTMIFLDEGVDTGDIIAQRRIPIAYDDTCSTLYRKVSDAAVEMLAENLPLLKQGRAPRMRQDHSLATVMPRRRPEDGEIDWTRTARQLYDWVRALTHPYPGAFGSIGGRRLFVWEAREASRTDQAPPGSVLSASRDGLIVAAGRGTIALGTVQWEGGPEIRAGALADLAGMTFDPPRRAA